MLITTRTDALVPKRKQLLTMSEKDRLPGWPYFLAAIMVAFAYQAGRELPDDGEQYTSEFYSKSNSHNNRSMGLGEEAIGLMDTPEDQDIGR